MVTKVKTALSGTQNSSAPSPDDISYRFIKNIKNSFLGEKIMEEVAVNLIKGTIPREWQNNRVVIIFKLAKDDEKRIGWIPINLINCIGKLVEKVVADMLQGCGLLPRY